MPLHIERHCHPLFMQLLPLAQMSILDRTFKLILYCNATFAFFKELSIAPSLSFKNHVWCFTDGVIPTVARRRKTMLHTVQIYILPLWIAGIKANTVCSSYYQNYCNWKSLGSQPEFDGLCELWKSGTTVARDAGSARPWAVWSLATGQ